MTVEHDWVSKLADDLATIASSQTVNAASASVPLNWLADHCEDILIAAHDSASVMIGGSSSAIRSYPELLHASRTGTVFLEGLERRSRTVSKLLGAFFVRSRLARANLYISAEGAPSATRPHRDGADLLIVTLAGRKEWHIGTTADYSWVASMGAHLETPECDHRLELGEGDLLFLPRGTAHWAQATEGPAMHLAISCTSPSVLEAYMWIAQDALGRMREMAEPMDVLDEGSFRDLQLDATARIRLAIGQEGFSVSLRLRELATVGSLAGARLLPCTLPPAGLVCVGSTWAIVLADAVFAAGAMIPVSPPLAAALASLITEEVSDLDVHGLPESDRRAMLQLLELGVLEPVRGE